MLKCFRLPCMILWTIILNSCSSANNKPLSIAFSTDSSSIILSNIDPAGLLQVRNTPHIDTSFSAVVAVTQIPAENDTAGIELPYPGRLTITDSTLVFRPVRPFVHGQDYLIVSYLNTKFSSPEMIWSGRLNNKVKPVQKKLSR